MFFDELGLAEPRYRLDLRTPDAEAMASVIQECLGAERPDWVLVYGDTNSTLAGALAATALELPLAHVEAGLRSGDLSMPEERNRIEVDRLAQLLLCPDERSREILAGEGAPGRAEVVGDVMADATRIFTPIAVQRSDRQLDEPYAVLTIHREANTEPERLATPRRRAERERLDVRLPGPPAHAQGDGRARDRAGPAAPCDRAGRLPRDARARRRRKPRRHRLGRPAEGGVLAAGPVRHPPALDRVGRHGSGRARTRWSIQTCSETWARCSRTRTSRRTRPSFTATATRPRRSLMPSIPLRAHE